MKSKFYTKFAMVFTAMAMFTFFAGAQTTINVKIVDGGDDVEEYQQDKDASADPPETAGFMDISSSDTELCNETDGVQQMVGFIFRNVQIPAGSTITNAYIQFTCDDDNEEVITLDIWGGKVANIAAPWPDVAFSISSTPKTTALVQWTPVSWLVLEERGPDQQTPDISSIIQEIIGVTGWASGNNLSIMFMDMSGTAKQHREAEAFEDNAGAGAAELVVTFSTGTAVNQVNEFSSRVYPNPAQDVLNITNPSADKFSYAIYSITGKLISSRDNLTGATTNVDLSTYAKGMYLIDVRSAETTETHKLIVR